MNTTYYAFLFPGQGAQTVGMGQALAAEFPTAAKIFQQADQILGFSLSELMFEGPEEALNDTFNTQPALLTHSIAALSVFSEQFPDIKPAYLAGHSMGELSALYAAKAVSFDACLTLARKRGDLMKKAGEIAPGGMAALIGLDTAKISELCDSITEAGNLVQIANDNCPGQVVVSGDTAGIDQIVEKAKSEGARMAIKLAVSIAAHSKLMETIQDEFLAAVEEAGIIDPKIPVIGNVNAQPLTTKDMIKSDLAAQLTSRVRWTESVEFLVGEKIDHFIEIGTGNVLTNLVKRINRKTKRFSFGAPADLTKFQ